MGIAVRVCDHFEGPGAARSPSSDGASSGPLRAREPTVSVRVVRELAAAVERAGIPRPRFLEAVKLDSDQLEAEHGRLLRSEVLAMCEVAMDLTHDAALGLHWAEQITANSFNLVPQLLAHAATLRDSFAMLLRFQGLLSDQIRLELIERADEVELRVDYLVEASPRVRMLVAEMTMLGFFRMLLNFSADHARWRVNFSHAAPTHSAEYTRLFDRTEQFEQPFTSLVFERALMDAPSPHRDEGIENSLRLLAEQRMTMIREHTPYALRVRSLLSQQRTPHRVPLKTVAQSLALSSRSLHRRLAEEGQSYAAIVNEISGLVAKRLLAGERHTIQQTAFAMGFSEVSSFHRAFKRWVGVTPTQFLDER